MNLADIKGVGVKREKILAGMGIRTPYDLIRFYPRRYLDLNTENDPAAVADGELCVLRCRLLSAPVTKVSKRGLRYVSAELMGSSEHLSAVWFNSRFAGEGLKLGTDYVFCGRVEKKETVTLINPQYRKWTGLPEDKRLQAVYTLPQELSQSVFSELISETLRQYVPVSVIPKEVAEREKLMDLQFALKLIHRPKDFTDVGAASSRLAVEELVQLMVALNCAAGVLDENERGRKYRNTSAEEFLAVLPFSLTDAQQDAVRRIADAMQGTHAMNLLLQGDVGSGKTVVAFYAMYLAVKNGYQAAMMAPTEVLALQNYQKAQALFSRLGYRTVYLSGSLTAAEKRNTLALIESGKASIAVGTHAVISKGVVFSDLGLAVTDEQHRFGVKQRLRLKEKGCDTDVLVMSATPIPRTLALVMYGDLDIVTIGTKPAGRKEVKTSLVPDTKYDAMFRYLAEQIAAGRQAYAVCPAIEDDPKGSGISVEKLFREIRSRLPGVTAKILHGGMKPAEKESVMAAFSRNEISLLVSTTVVEVGVDVANANIMIIFDADRFGLSQLHQLRGRVGRGSLQSYCFLLTATENQDAIDRLKVMVSTNDGFEIANRDFEWRGGGEFFGNRQSGFDCSVLKRVKFDGRVVERARTVFREISVTQEYVAFFLENCGSEYRSVADAIL